MTTGAAADHVVEHANDYRNRWVRKALDSDGDGHLDGRRIFISDGNQMVMDFRRANSQDMQIGHLRERYLWGPAADQILAEEAVDGGTADLVQWTMTDHLSTVRDIAKSRRVRALHAREAAKELPHCAWVQSTHVTYCVSGMPTDVGRGHVRNAGLF